MLPRAYRIASTRTQLQPTVSLCDAPILPTTCWPIDFDLKKAIVGHVRAPAFFTEIKIFAQIVHDP